MKLLLIRVGMAFFSSAIFAFLSQIAVFVYTRSVDAPIPAGNIVGLSSSSMGSVLGFLLLFILLIALLIKSGFRLLSSSTSGSNLDFDEIVKGHYWWGLVPVVLAITISLTFVFCTPCTSSMLRFLGYGGGLEICQLSDNSMVSAKSGDTNQPARLILLTSDAVYIQFGGAGYNRYVPDGLSMYCDGTNRAKVE